VVESNGASRGSCKSWITSADEVQWLVSYADTVLDVGDLSDEHLPYSTRVLVCASTAAAATTGSETAELDLDDVVTVSEVSSPPTADLLEGLLVFAVDADESLTSPFDSPGSPDSIGSPESPDSPDSADPADSR
jgi:hypothetical protein